MSVDRMDRKHALYVALSAASVVFCLVFAFPAFHPIALPWYYPLEHRWAIEVRPQGLAMDWYGRTLLACGASVLAHLAVYLFARRWRPLSSSSFALWAGWVATATLLAMSLYAYQLAVRRPTPEPLPAWYVPK